MISFPGERILIFAGFGVAATLVKDIGPSVLCIYTSSK